jgi:hypothetical protein
MESVLADLRRSWDERLSMLQDQSASIRLWSIIRGGVQLNGKVKIR